MVEIIRYDATMAAQWNELARQCRNSTFQHQRGYMDYHSDRFTDCSLIALHNGKPRAPSAAGLCRPSTLTSPS